MRGWIFANLFLLSLALVGAGLFWLFGALLRIFGAWGIGVAGVIAILVTGWIMARAHRRLERSVNRRAH